MTTTPTPLRERLLAESNRAGRASDGIQSFALPLETRLLLKEAAREIERLREIEHRTWHVFDDSEDAGDSHVIDKATSRVHLDALFAALPEDHPAEAALSARDEAGAVLDPQLASFYQVDSVAGLLAAMEEHIERLQESARRNVKPWEDTFPPTLLPKYLRDNGLPETPAPTAVVHVHTASIATPPAASGEADPYVTVANLDAMHGRWLALATEKRIGDQLDGDFDILREASALIRRLAAVAPAGMDAVFTADEVAEAMEVLRGRHGSTALLDEVLDDMERVLLAAAPTPPATAGKE